MIPYLVGVYYWRCVKRIWCRLSRKLYDISVVNFAFLNLPDRYKGVNHFRVHTCISGIAILKRLCCVRRSQRHLICRTFSICKSKPGRSIEFCRTDQNTSFSICSTREWESLHFDGLSFVPFHHGFHSSIEDNRYLLKTWPRLTIEHMFLLTLGYVNYASKSNLTKRLGKWD